MAEILIEFALLGIALLLVPIGLVFFVLGLRRQQHKRLILGVGCLLISGVLWWRTDHVEFWLVDRCLDAGGRYDYQAQECEFE